jgi:thiol:disulfide interchange protein
MKKTFFLFFLVMTISVMAQEGGIRFLQDSTLDAALVTANTMHKPLFVDCYTVWCGPCKHVDKNVFPQKEVGDFYNANFACVRLNTELNCNKGINERLNINAVPSFFFSTEKVLCFIEQQVYR